MGRTSDGVAPPPLRRGVFGMRPSVRVAVMGEGRAGRGGVCLFGDPRAISRRPSFPRRAIVAYLESRKRPPRCVAQRMGAALGSAYASSSASKFRDVRWRNLPAMETVASRSHAVGRGRNARVAYYRSRRADSEKFTPPDRAMALYAMPRKKLSMYNGPVAYIRAYSRRTPGSSNCA